LFGRNESAPTQTDLALYRAKDEGRIGLARELDVEVIAQGVETEAQRDLLTRSPSTTKVQGFCYSAPVPAFHATEMLRQRLIEPSLSQVPEATAAQ
jgi:predicted signal transduction protein with EAL and GGDEF domain